MGCAHGYSNCAAPRLLYRAILLDIFQTFVNNEVQLKLQYALVAMKTISMLDFRNDAERILAQVMNGERMVLTRRGKPVARLEPIVEETPDEKDSFYSLIGLVETGKSLSNKQIDDILYGK